MPALSMTGVRKEFPGVVALDGVDFSIEPGEIRALMGENGAGKSTLIKVLTGVHAMDQGEILLNGQRITPMSPAHSQELGISTVYQEIDLVPNLTVAENVCLGCETGGLVNWRAMKERARKAIDPLGIKVDVTRALGEYPIAIQQLVSIARAIDRNATILILDEPTSSLDREEVARLFDLMRGLKEKGLAIVFVTHFLDQVFSIADSVTMLRNGHRSVTGPSLRSIVQSSSRKCSAGIWKKSRTSFMSRDRRQNSYCQSNLWERRATCSHSHLRSTRVSASDFPACSARDAPKR
jgi:simple sugar transport system ATP-binding protein